MKKMFLTLLIMVFGAGAANAMSVEKIIERANEASYYKGDDGRAKVKMKIVDSQDRERERQFTILRKNTANQSQRFYVYFERPSDVKKMSFLVYKYVKGDDDRWMYLPSLDLVKRISAGDQRTSFVGSHFYYEDVSGRNPNADVHTLVDTDDTYYVVESKPKDQKSVEFSKYKTWIHKLSFLPIRTVYYDSKGQEYRTYTATKVETVKGYPTVVAAEMKDDVIGGKTILTYENVSYDVGLPDDIFTERYLKKAPTQYLK